MQIAVPDPSVVRIDPGSVRKAGQHERLRPAGPDVPDLADALRQLGYAFNTVAFELGVALDKALSKPVADGVTLADVLLVTGQRQEARDRTPPDPSDVDRASSRRDASWHKRHRRLKGRRG